MITDLQAAARTLGRQLVLVNARTESDLETAFITFSKQRVAALLVTSSTLFHRRMEQMAALAARQALPAIYPYREYALAGGLMSYGSSIGYLYHQVGIYAGPLASGQKSNGSKGLSSTEASDLCVDSRNACKTGVFSNGRTDKICRKV
jgi:putative tryptophan/tyrosine transport system substrate-binding protein